MQLEASTGQGTDAQRIQRRYPRALFSVPVTLHHLTPGSRPTRGITLSIAEGGMGALVQGSLSVGETLTVDVPLPECMLSAIAVVRYSSRENSGLEFIGLTPEQRTHITRVVGHA